MIDTIKASMAIPKEGKILQVLENQRTIVNPQTRSKKITGKIKNISFHVHFNPDGKVCRVNFIGSLNKFIYDNNFVLSNRLDVKKAVKSLSNITGLPLHKATLKRLDIGACFIMKYPVTSYLLLLDGLQGRYKKTNIANETIYFFNGRRAFAFYDKIKENKKRKTLVPSDFNDKYVLRYELRYYKALEEQFDMRKIIVSDLYDVKFYKLIKRRWRKGYFKIIKYRIQDLNKVRDLKSLSAFLTLNGIEKVGGLAKVISMIDSFCLREKINPGGKHRLKKRIRELYSQRTTSIITKEVMELNKKVKAFGNIRKYEHGVN
ncbi:MAG: hypothetical protein H0W84_02170 [Bacteroidetes bacterium]|nr:hypothetical protein [Bacteroidota bacterium]